MMDDYAIQFQSFINRLQFNSSPYYYLNDVFVNNLDGREKTRLNNVSLTCTVIAWALLYSVFKKYSNKFLKQRKFGLIQRNRIIDSFWSWTFHVIGLFYLRFYHLSDVSSAGNLTNLHLVFILLKSFCLHFVWVQIFNRSAWISGLSYLLFTLFVFSDSDDCFNPYILYVCSIKMVDVLILEACRFLFILWKDNCGNVFSKFLFGIHFVYWIYMFFYFVPNFILSPDKEIDSIRLPYFYLWYISEWIDTVWIQLFRYSRTEPWLKTYLFIQSNESLLLMKIHKRHEEGFYKNNMMSVRLKKQIDLWKTVKCAIAVKKTLHRKAQQYKAQKEQRRNIENIVIEPNTNIDKKEN